MPAPANTAERAAVSPTASRLECTPMLINAHSPAGSTRTAVRPSFSRTRANISGSRIVRSVASNTYRSSESAGFRSATSLPRSVSPGAFILLADRGKLARRREQHGCLLRKPSDWRTLRGVGPIAAAIEPDCADGRLNAAAADVDAKVEPALVMH